MKARTGAWAAVLVLAVFVVPWILVLPQLDSSLFGTDVRALYPAARAVWQLRNPYQEALAYYSPPWMLLILAPLSRLPVQPAYILWTIAGAAAYLIAFRRMGMDWLTTFLLLLSPPAIGNLVFGNFDWLILLGATLPPALGIWFVALKPQLGIVLAALWSGLSLKRGWRTFSAVVVPIALASLMSFLLGYRLPSASQMHWSADVWPWGIPVGALLAYFSFRRRDPLLSLAAAPFLSPYVVWHSWIVVLLPLSRVRWAFAAGILASWVVTAWLFGW